jgi:hypothetical protein
MPKYKLEKEYGDDKHAIFGTMNKIGAMKGNKETKKGEKMETKHDEKVEDKKKKIAKKIK